MSLKHHQSNAMEDKFLLMCVCDTSVSVLVQRISNINIKHDNSYFSLVAKNVMNMNVYGYGSYIIPLNKKRHCRDCKVVLACLPLHSLHQRHLIRWGGDVEGGGPALVDAPLDTIHRVFLLHLHRVT